MYLTKHHGLGNDFLVTFVDEVPSDAPKLAMAMCDRRTGVGADGLIFGVDVVDPVMFRLFNSDGSPAEVSGNGLRCFVQALAMRRGIDEIDVNVDTPAGIRACQGRVLADPAEMLASADMGSVGPGDQPDTPEFLAAIDGLGTVDQWGLASVGNPHIVFRVPDPDNIDLSHVGPQIESHFRHGVNAHFVRAVGDDHVVLRPWERGAGATQACGSGATVAAQLMYDWGYVPETVRVEMPGGTATVDVMTAERPTAVLRGNATFVATVQVPHHG